MKLLTITVPSYNSEAYLDRCIQTLIQAGDEVEVLIVNDGSTDRTGEIADGYQAAYPSIVRAIHKPNGGHGSAVMAGLNEATGLFFRVVDSDDWLDAAALTQVLDQLRQQAASDAPIDLLLTNYVYDKVGVRHKRAVAYENAIPTGKVVRWEDFGRFRVGQYILMHATTFRTQVLRDCGLQLPEHTFYVDNLYVYVPMPRVNRLFYLPVNLYHYFIGRDDQSVNEPVMLRRVDQQLRVNRMMMDAVDLQRVQPIRKQQYMRNYLEIITMVSSTLLIRSGTQEHLAKLDALWQGIQKDHPQVYRMLMRRGFGRIIRLPKGLRKVVVDVGYCISRKWFGFN